MKNKEDQLNIAAVIDGDFIPFYVCHNKKGDEPKTLDDCLYICDDFINNINKAVKSDVYLGFLTKGKCFRYNINPSYKGNRKYDNIPNFSNEIREHLINTHGFTYQEGYEADDLVLSFKKQNKEYNSIIVSPDKDILLLEGKHFNPREMKFVETDEVTAAYKFWSDMIIGQPGDNIKGIPGKGKSFAEKLLFNIEDEESLRTLVFDEYINYFEEYEGIKEFTKNYLSLKLVDNVSINQFKLNNVDKIVCE